MFNKIIYFARASDSSSLLDYVRVISTPIIIIIIIGYESVYYGTCSLYISCCSLTYFFLYHLVYISCTGVY